MANFMYILYMNSFIGFIFQVLYFRRYVLGAHVNDINAAKVIDAFKVFQTADNIAVSNKTENKLFWLQVIG